MIITRIFLITAIVLSCTSCKTDHELKQEAAAIAQERIQAIDYGTVDSYPLFLGCDEMQPGPDCFYEKLHEVVAQRLGPAAANLKMSTNDTMVLSMTVAANGHLTYDKLLELPNSMDQYVVDSILTTRLRYLPRLSAALKQGVPVKTSYKLPVILVPTDSLIIAPGAAATAR